MSKKIAYGGILLGLNIILLLLSSIIPINTIFFMGLSSLPIAIVIMQYGPKTGAMFYMASIILSFIVLQNKVQWIMYVFTFGIYGLIKYLIEKGRTIFIEIILKLGFANLTIIILYSILKYMIVIPINLFTIISFQIAFIIYDYVYSLFIDYYEENLKKKIGL